MAQQKDIEKSEHPAEKRPARPASLMRRMMDDFERMFEEPFLGRGFMQGGANRAPAIDVFERGDKLVVRADVPGYSRDDIKLECTDEGLILEGERKDEREQKEGGFYRRERTYGRFRRAIALPDGVDYESVRAEMKDGVLEVYFPLPQPRTERKKIEISGGESSTEKKSVH